MNSMSWYTTEAEAAIKAVGRWEVVTRFDEDTLCDNWIACWDCRTKDNDQG